MYTYTVYRESLIDIVTRMLAGLWFDSSGRVSPATHSACSSMVAMFPFPRSKDLDVNPSGVVQQCGAVPPLRHAPSWCEQQQRFLRHYIMRLIY